MLPFRPTREGWHYLAVLAVVLGGAMFREVNLLIAVAGMMLGALVVNAVLAAQGVRKLTVERRLPDRAVAGEPALVELTIDNSQRWSSAWAVGVEDAVRLLKVRRDGPRPQQAFALVPRAPARGRQVATYALRLERRGRWRLGPAKIVSSFPLGLIEAWRASATVESLLVWPALGALTEAGRRLLAAESLGEDARQTRRGAGEGEFYGVREWRLGDRPRAIHWRTSAKLGRLAVRQFEQPRGVRLALVLDLWRAAEEDEPADDRVEAAVSFAATLIAETCRRGAGAALLATAGEGAKVHRGGASSLFLREALDWLALVEASPSPPLREILAQAEREMSAGARLIVVSTRSQREALGERRAATLAETIRDCAAGPITWIEASEEGLLPLWVGDVTSPPRSG